LVVHQLENRRLVSDICSPQDGSTPLTAAAWGGHLDIVKLLLDNGANIEAVNNTVGAES
jgi:ankyrin repeat protein